MGEPLIKVISESANGPSASPALFTPLSPLPPLESKNLMDGSGDRPRNYPMLYCASRTLAIIYRFCLAPRGTCVGIVFEFAMSYVFSLDMVITSQDIIIGCDNAGIDIDNITSVQHCASNNLWVVTFDSKAVKDAALNKHSINIPAAPFSWEIVKTRF